MATYDKIYTVTSISHLIPIKLDITKLNYPHWSKLFAVHCEGFDVGKFIQAEPTTEEQTSANWKKADSVVQKWFYSTISESLLERLLNDDCQNAYQAWIFLQKIFQDNKRSKTLELTAELRSISIDDQTIDEYFRRIDKIAAQLKNLRSTVADPDLVTYAVNGLNEKFPHASHIILLSEPFPNYETVRSMLTLEELQFHRKNRSSSSELTQGTSSSPSVLIAQTTSPPSHNHRPPPSSPQVCRNFSRGSCRFGDKCRYLHQVNRQSGTIANFPSGNVNRPNGNTQAQLLGIIAAQQQVINQYSLNRPNNPLYQPFGPRTPLANYTSPPGFNQQTYQANLVGPGTNYATYGSKQPLQQVNIGPPSNLSQPMIQSSSPQQFILGPFAAAPQPTQETILPHAFSATTLPDYGNTGWTMDTGASTHLTSSINNLSTIFNHCMHPSVAVGDGNTIPVTNTGYSVLPNVHRPLHLNNDYLTSRLLLRCDSTGDLYPFTSQTSSPAHHALLTTPSIWHQRLGHPSTDVFRHLISNNISCNKTKSHVLYHACQLGKHVRLPFSTSSSNVNALFDIVQSDLWTSPVPSLGGYKYYVIFLDHFSHYLWVFPLRNKSDVFTKFIQFRAYIKTQLKSEIKAFQCDLGGEFDNNQIHQLFQDNGIQIRFSCPQTSQQNEKSERMILTINNLIRTLRFQAHFPSTFWVDALHMDTYLLNLLPSSSINNEIPHTRLYKYPPTYFTLRVFGCLCYPHLNTTNM
ncbi:uncharacterized protein [Rutidosis leptorrhynchoides]|uniref:uncharacterized protein n=1 Tax=Rutidosis leptorrhynchoides TaxID=125765 RepID=UPI003A9A273A